MFWNLEVGGQVRRDGGASLSGTMKKLSRGMTGDNDGLD